MIDRVESKSNLFSRWTLRRTLAVLLGVLVVGPALARTRAVRSGPHLSQLFLAPAATQVVVTNHALVPAIVSVCVATCMLVGLGAGATSEYDLSPLGVSTLVVLRSDVEHLEARTEHVGMVRASDLSTERQVVPIVDLTRYRQTLIVLSLTGGVLDVARRAKNGVQEDVKNYTLGPGLTRIPHAYGVATTHEQLEIRPNVPVSTLLEVKNENGTTYLQGKRLDTATGIQFLTNTKNATVWIKDPDLQGSFVGNGYVWPNGQDNTNTHLQRGISTMPGGIANTTIAADKQSSFEVIGADITPLKFIAWGLEGSIALPFLDLSAGATGRSAVNDTTQRSQMSFNRPGTLTLMNATSDKGNVSGKILSYDNAGTHTSSQDYTLGWKENRTLNVNAARTTITVNDAVGSDMRPRVIGTMQHENVVFGPHQMPRRLTGLEVVQRFFDPVAARGGYYLNNHLTRCTLTGECGVPGLRTDLAALYVRGIGETWTTEQFEHWLTEMTDGVTSTTNIELWSKAKPRGWGTGGISYAVTRSQDTFTNEPGSIRLTAADAELHRILDREFIIRYFDQNPEQGCGTSETGPSLDPNCLAYTFAIRNAHP